MGAYKVLVTGGAGSIGRVVCRELMARGHQVRNFDLVKNEEVGDNVVGTLTDKAAVDQAMAGMDTLIHLAAEPNDCDFLSRLVPANVVGLYHVMDAARREKLRRTVLASSMQVISGLRRMRQMATGGEMEPKGARVVRVEDGAAPLNHYAVTKVFAEAMGQMYALEHGMSVIAVRIGWYTRNLKELQHMAEHKAWGSYLSHDDAAHFFRRCVEAENIKYACLFAVSKRRNEGGLDTEAARRTIGYEPINEFPDGLSFEVPPEIRAMVKA